MSSHTKLNHKLLSPQSSRCPLPSSAWWRCWSELQRVDWCKWTWRRHYWFLSPVPEVSASRHSFRGVTTGLRSHQPHGQIESITEKKADGMTKQKKNKKTAFTETLRTPRLKNIRGTVLWGCVTVPHNLGHNVQAVQLREGKREKISSSRQPCILATPLKRRSFCEPQGVLLWPAANYANTHFDLEQTARCAKTRDPEGTLPRIIHPRCSTHQVKSSVGQKKKNIRKGDWWQPTHTHDRLHLGTTLAAYHCCNS